ncbi:MAG: hypothetical protein Q8P07_06170 [bacterium]|nr:hypothetical protein [bacterium]
MKFPDICGWIGTILLLAAFGLVSQGYLDARSMDNQWMNFLGAVGIGYNSYEKSLWAVVVLDCFWAAVALITIVQLS